VVAVLFIVTFATMFMVDLGPGDPASVLLGDAITPQLIKQVHHDLGLDKPLIERYGSWVAHAATLDFGKSYRTKQPVWSSIRQRLPVTLELALLAQLLALLVAIPVALWTAYRADGRLDRLWSVGSSLAISSPAFVLGLVLAYFLGVRARWFPVTGWTPFGQSPLDNLRGAFLPALTLAVGEIAVYSRLLRADIIATLQEDYVLAARSRGLSDLYVLVRHALRPSSFSLLTLAGLSLGRLIGGAVVVESLFALPGVGQLLIISINTKDVLTVQGIVVFVALAYVVINATIDVGYAWLDPRVRGVYAR